MIATHLEGNADLGPLSTDAKNALQRLARMQREGLILVVRTSRLLKYNLVNQYLQYSVTTNQGSTRINIQQIQDPVFGSFVPSVNDLTGITFHVSDPNRVQVAVNGGVVSNSQMTITSHTIGFP